MMPATGIRMYLKKDSMFFRFLTKAFYRLSDFSNLIRSLQITLCDMDLINSVTPSMQTVR